MRLLLIRHAAAVPGGTPGVADEDRPLTPRGRARFERAARGLARIADRPDVLLTSPLPRARATAEIAARAFGRVEPVVEPALVHGPAAIVAALARQPVEATIAIVGHEPTLGSLLAQLLEGADGTRFAFKKGGAALVALPEGPRAPGRLVWLVRPRILRTIGDD